MKMQNNYYICKWKWDKKYCRVWDHWHYTGEYRGVAHSKRNLKYNEPKETPTVFNNGYNYDYHLIMKELAKEFEGEFICLGENTKKYLTLSVPVEKEVIRIDKKKMENESQKTYLTNYNLLVVQDFCQSYYQILLKFKCCWRNS